jgi:aspartyl aminopeptidase
MLVGAGEDMISIGRLDDLMMSYAALRGICEANTDNTKTAVVILTDNEEVGSLTMSGASGCFPTDVLRAALGDNYGARLKNTVALSADLAHAVNPAHPELHEPLSRPYLNGGMVLKRAANKSYSTDGVSGAVFKRLCEETGVKYQQFTNPSDRPGGTTIGPMLSAAAGISVADIGAPVMAMHSIRELGGVNDAFDSFKLFKNWFEK